ncbi:ComEA family DNA-binding protein [Paenibacillus montanisoli]|nr:helix-hairpin-helix domain-containing protein [Paenibacillus montanisoli]
MKTKRTGIDRQLLLIGLLFLAAIALAASAFARPRAAAPTGWIPVNAEVEQALKPLEQGGDEKKPVAKAAQVHEKAAESHAASPAESRSSKPADVVKPKAGMGKIDINHATAEELDAIPGIGAAKAKSIVEDRKKNGLFRKADDLLRVKGIGPKLLEKMKSSIVVQP